MEHPLTLVDFIEMYPTEDACREAIFEHRWREGFRCPRCNHARAWYLRGRGLFQCSSCGHQASVTAGTALHKTRTDLRKWVLAIWMLASMKKPPSAAELSRQLGVTGKTAWLLRRKITHAMRRGEHELMLRGIVEFDESLIGGHERGAANRGRASRRKTLVAVSVEQTADGGVGRAHLRVIENASAKTLTAAARQAIQPRSHIVISNFKRWQLDVFHGVSAAHPRVLPRRVLLPAQSPW
jgi:transposase-like protein